MLTQLARSSEARKITIDAASMTVTPRFEQSGSILADTVSSRLIDVETSLEIASSASTEEISQLVETSERMCFMMDVIKNSHPTRSTVRLNGEPLSTK
jgi:hypothetical protein